ncbi:MAG: HAMP domain-containing histidine kinase [Ruminococcus sp.]|nr:HAMP domain-containing histidine kinase [Ruminococcus sp.]
MDIFESVKAVFTQSGTPAALCDTSLRLRWKNSPEIPESLIPDDFTGEDGEPPILPIREERMLRFRTGGAALVTPLTEGEECKGYLVRFFPADSIERLITHSDKAYEQVTMLDNVRYRLQGAISALEAREVEDYPFQVKETFHEIKLSMLRSLACTVNFAEASRVFGGHLDILDTELSSLLRRTTDHYSQFIDPKALRVICRPGLGVCVMTDYAALEPVLLNLIVNAYMYNDAREKEVVIRLINDGTHGVLTVTDNGTSADLEKIERASHYLGQKPVFGKGESLGLAIARELCRRCGGSIGFEHSETGGLKVILKFPLLGPDSPLTLGAPPTDTVYMPYDPPYCILGKAFDLYVEPFELQ